MSLPEEAAGYVLKKDEGRGIWFLDALLTWKALAKDTDGQWELVEQWGPRGFAAPLHSHHREAEGFYLLEGAVDFVLGEDRLPAAKGAFMFVPPGTKHSFVVESDEAKFLTLISPASLEGFFDELGRPAAEVALPPRHDGPPDIERFDRVATSYGQQTFGPPPTPRT